MFVLSYLCIDVCVFFFLCVFFFIFFVFFQAEDGIRDLVRSRGLGDVYKRQCIDALIPPVDLVYVVNDAFAFGRQRGDEQSLSGADVRRGHFYAAQRIACLLYTSDAADERSSVDLGGRRIIKNKTH